MNLALLAPHRPHHGRGISGRFSSRWWRDTWSNGRGEGKEKKEKASSRKRKMKRQTEDDEVILISIGLNLSFFYLIVLYFDPSLLALSYSSHRKGLAPPSSAPPLPSIPPTTIPPELRCDFLSALKKNQGGQSNPSASSFWGLGVLARVIPSCNALFLPCPRLSPFPLALSRRT